MSAPTLAGTWYTRANMLFADVTTAANINKSYFFMLKDVLKGNASGGTEGPLSRPGSTFWTVEGSSDGSTAGMDGVDRWTNTFNASLLVQAASGAAHSWIVLKSPNGLGPLYMCIDLNSATTTTAGVVFSLNAFTGGSTTNRPTTTNAFAAGTSADPILTTNAALVSDNTLASTYRGHFSTDANGAFNFMMSRDGTGICSNFMAVFVAADRNASDNTYIQHCIFHALNSGVGAPSIDAVGSTSSWVGNRSQSGGTPNTTGGLSRWTFGGSAFPGVATVDQGGTDFRALPLYIHSLTTSNMSWRGRVPDIWAVGNITIGSSYPNAVSPTQHVIGTALIPMSVVPIL